MHRKKLLSGVISVLLMLSMALGGCSSRTESTKPTPNQEINQLAEGDKTQEPDIDLSKEVKLTMYLLGDRTPDFDRVFGMINEKLKEKINATLDVKFMSWGEYEQKYPLLFASGEEFDIIYSADWAFYNSQAVKQGFYEITQENLEKYAPMTASTIYKEAWEQAKVEGKVYMLPMNYKELSGYVYMARGDLMDK